MSRTIKNTEGKNYHHGDLRNALIVAAAQLIEENGSIDFAMIDAARRAGVSSAAPYRHFRDKEALLGAVTEVGFLALAEKVQAVAAVTSAGTAQSIVAQGKAYASFVTEHPAFYDLMWGDMGLPGPDPELKTSGFYILVETVEAWCQASNIGNYDALELSVKLWANAHGLACLAMNGQVKKFIPEVDLSCLLESSIHTFLDGLLRPS